uniref:LRRCT domain-containing protein n=2 Tax=Clastoptera arizonana TaxID=38151 RepID=A0A1B6DP94_9HEMI
MQNMLNFNVESTMKLLILLFVASGYAADYCPKHCTCVRPNGGAIATCTRLDPLNQQFSDDIAHLVLKSEEKITFEDGIFLKLGLDQLYTIQAINTSLESVHVNAFSGLSKLNEIDLSDNNIILIHPDTFKNNSNLKTLTLSGNPLQLTQVLESKQNYFLSSSTLRNLELSRCQLTELKPNTFSHLPNLEYINLSSNLLKNLDSNTFESVKFLDEIDLSNNNISSFTTELFYDIDDLSILNLRNNSLTNFDYVDIADLKQLDLSYNHLTEINSQTFDGVPDLTHLNISNNRIERISEDALTDMSALRYLDLSYNSLKGPLPEYLLEQNKELETLHLAGNKNLGEFRRFAGHFSLLYKLDISNCGLRVIKNDSFHSMPYIAILDMSTNSFNSLPKGLFSNLHRLNDLELAHNNLEKLDTDLFINNSHLRKLNLHSNQLSHVPITVFKTTPLLTILDLSNNFISYLWRLENTEYINSNNFLSKLEFLNLNGNQLKFVHRSNFEIFTSLKTLDIFNNPIKCDKLFATFIEWLISHNIKSAKYVGKSGKIELESELKNIEWQDLWRMVCDEPYSKPAIDKTQDENNEDVINNTIFITDRIDTFEVEEREMVKVEEAYIWPMVLFILCGFTVILAVGNLLVLVIYKLRDSNLYSSGSYKSAFIAPFRHTGMTSDGSSRYHKLYEECSVPNPPTVKTNVFTAPIMDSLAKLHYSVITKPQSKDENLV